MIDQRDRALAAAGTATVAQATAWRSAARFTLKEQDGSTRDVTNAVTMAAKRRGQTRPGCHHCTVLATPTAVDGVPARLFRDVERRIGTASGLIE